MFFWPRKKEQPVAKQETKVITPPIERNGITLLLVDGDASFVQTFSSKLEADGFTVLSALDCAEGLALMREERPHAVLLDVNFPPDCAHGGGWDGFMLMQWSRSFGLKYPVFMLSASDDPRVRQRAVQLGATQFFTKPLDYWELRTALEKHIGAKLPEAALGGL